MSKVKNILFLDFRTKLGLSLVFCGVSFSMLLNYILPIFDSWSSMIMAFSILCLIDFKFKGTVANNSYLNLILFFQILAILYYYISPPSEQAPITYQFYILILIFVIRRNHKILKCDFLPFFFLFTSLLCVCFAYFHFKEYFSWEYIHMNFNDEKVLEVFSANIAAYANLMVCFVFLNKSKRKTKMFFLLLILIDLYIIFQSGKRSYFVTAFMALLFLLYKQKTLSQQLPSIVIIAILLLFVPTVRDAVMSMFTGIVDGITHIFFSGEHNYDEYSSNAQHSYMLYLALVKLSNFSIFNFIFGSGYYDTFSDNPLLQSYMDLGLVGFISYVYIIIVKPIKISKKLNTNDSLATFAFLFSILSMVACITNGHPYLYYTFTPLCLLSLKGGKDRTI